MEPLTRYKNLMIMLSQLDPSTLALRRATKIIDKFFLRKLPLPTVVTPTAAGLMLHWPVSVWLIDEGGHVQDC